MARVLIVDDDATWRMFMRLALERAGHQVSEAANGLAGLKQSEPTSVDLIVVDIFMPEMDGIEMIAAIRKKRLDQTTPILAVSGDGQLGKSAILRMAGQLGADRVLAKPFDVPEFMAMVATMLAHPRDHSI